jgi:hypothetical protein
MLAFFPPRFLVILCQIEGSVFFLLLLAPECKQDLLLPLILLCFMTKISLLCVTCSRLVVTVLM